MITPSLPTASIASATICPTSDSLPEIVAINWICSLLSIGFAISAIASTIASTALSIPRLILIGFPPAATSLSPSLTIAWASTVAVVVPSPALSLVLLETWIQSCAPKFSYGSSSSTAFATVTPSLVTIGPEGVWITTFLPFGPSVTRTALATSFKPRSKARRASSSKIICLAGICIP